MLSTVDEARALNAQAQAVSRDKQRFAFNPFVARPLIDLGAAGVWAPQTMLVSRAIFPSNLYYVGMKQWDKPFADNLGDRVEQYVGRQLRLLGGDHVEGDGGAGRCRSGTELVHVTVGTHGHRRAPGRPHAVHIVHPGDVTVRR